MSINPKIRRKLKMLFPKRQSEISFYQWMLENWAIEGGTYSASNSGTINQCQ